MDRYRQRTIAELLKKTSKINRPRMTPILEGKDRMRGPLDITDPDMDFASLQVCGNCRNHLDASIAQNCGICKKGHHSFCLEAPPNEAEDRSVQCCYDCQHKAALDSNQPGSSLKDSHSKLSEDRMDVCRSNENVPECEEPGTSYDASECSPATEKMDLSWNEASPSKRTADSGGTIFDTLYKPTKTRAARKLGIRRKRVTDSIGLDSPVLPSETDTLVPVQESSGMDIDLEDGGVLPTCLGAVSEESKDCDHLASCNADIQISTSRITMRGDLEDPNGNQLLEVHVGSPTKDAECTVEEIATGDKLVKAGNVTGAEKMMDSPKLDIALTAQPVSRDPCVPIEDCPTDVSATLEAPSVGIQEEMRVVGPLNSRDSTKEEHFSNKIWNAAPQMIVEQDVDGEKQILIVRQVNSADQLPKQDDDAHRISAPACDADLPPQNTSSQGTCSPTPHRASAVDAPKSKSSSSVLDGQAEDEMSKPAVFVDMRQALPSIQEEMDEHLSNDLTNKAGHRECVLHKEHPSPKAHMDIDNNFTGSETTHAGSLSSSSNARVAMEDEIKVCDLCGDAGYEDMLAICSECNGAEHVYCYQNLMAQVPEGYWQCDVCKLKQKDFRPSTDIRTVNPLPTRLPSFNSTRKHSNVGNSRSRLSALLQKRRLPSEKKRAMKGIPSSQFPAKRGLPGVDAPPTKKQVVEASSPPYMASAASLKLGLIKESSFKIPDTGKVKFVSHTALMGSTGEGTGLSSRGNGKLSLSIVSPSSIPLNSSTVQSGQLSKGRFLSASNSILGPGNARANTTSQSNIPSSSVPLLGSGLKTSGGALKSSEAVPSFLLPLKSTGPKLQLSSKSLKETTDSLGPQSLPKEGLLGQSSISSTRGLSKTGSFKLSKGISIGGSLEPKVKQDVNLDSTKSSGSRIVHPEVGIVKAAESKYEAVLNSGLPEIKSKAVAATEPLETHNGVDKLVKHEPAGSLRVTNSPSKDETVLVASGTCETQQSSALGSPVKDVQDSSIEQERQTPFQVTSPHSSATQMLKLPEQLGPETTSMDVIQYVPSLPRPVIVIQESSALKEDENKPLQLAVTVDVVGDKNVMAAIDKAPAHDDNRSSFTPRSRSFGAWGSPSYVPSLGSTRCYRCKELGHSAKNCNNRSSMPCVSSEAAGALKAVLPASNVDSTCVLKGVMPAITDNATRSVQSNVEAIPKIKPTTEMAAIIKPSSTERGVLFTQNLNSLVGEAQLPVEEGQVVEDVTPSSSPLVDQATRKDAIVSKQIADSVLSPTKVNVCGAHHTDDTRETADGKEEDNTSVHLANSTVVNVPEWQPPLLSIPTATRSAAHLLAALTPVSSTNVKATSPPVSRYQESLKVYPEAQIVWQGTFEVAGKAKPQVSFHGLQANPSNLALPKVREVAKKLQALLPLEELPRGSEHNSWPVQFQKSPPINDNIALYFFASGKESYVQYYKPLVDRLIKFDLTLKGFIEDAELLIFPSNLLPPGSQCWNNFMFLWAVFRARKLPTKQPNMHFTSSEAKQGGSDSGLRLPLQSGVLAWGKVEDMQIDSIANKNIDVPPAAGNKSETPSLTIAQGVNTVGPGALSDSDVVICEQSPPCQQESQHLMQVEAAAKEEQKAQTELIHSQPEKALTTVLLSTQDGIVVKSQPLSDGLLAPEGGLNLNSSNESSQKFDSSIKLEEKVDTNVKLVVPSAPKVSSALLRSEHGSIEKTKHSTPLMGTSPALLVCPSPRDRQEDVWTPRKLSSQSPAGQQDKDKGVRERTHEKSDKMESGRGVSRDRDREKQRDREKHKERDRDRERSRRHSDWEREKERERGKERERDRDRERERDRGRERERERERDRERWRDREERDRRGRDWDRDRDKVGERDKGRERGREREAERERALTRDRSRHRHWDPADADYGRSSRHWHRYPRSRTPSRSPPGNRDLSPLRPRIDRYYHRYHRSFRHSRSYSHSPDSDHGLARLQPRAESRDLSKDSFAPKGKSPDVVLGDSRAKEESAVKNSAIKDSGGDEQGNYSQRGSNSNSLCRENTAGKERKLPIADLNLSPSEIEGNEEEGNDDDVMMSVEVAKPLTAHQDDHTSGCHDFLPVNGKSEEPGECSISAGKMINNQGTEHRICVDEITDSRSLSLINDSSGPSYLPVSVSLEGSSSCLQFFPQPMDDDNRVPYTPDLSLALGGKERGPPQQAELPLFMQLLEPSQERSRLGSFNPPLDVSMITEQADLSLSLAIPEHSKRPVVNTSLRLFG